MYVSKEKPVTNVKITPTFVYTVSDFFPLPTSFLSDWLIHKVGSACFHDFCLYDIILSYDMKADMKAVNKRIKHS